MRQRSVRRIKKGLASGIMAACLIAGSFFGQKILPAEAVYATDEATPAAQWMQYEQVMDDAIAWVKAEYGIGNEQPLFSGEFLKNAGTTAGDWYAIAIGRMGYADDYNAYLTALKTYVQDRYEQEGGLDRSKATEWHRIALAVLSLGGDPTEFGQTKDGAPINLIADGSYQFETHTGYSLANQGANGLIWALLMLDGRRYEIPQTSGMSRNVLVEQLLEIQNEDGGFALLAGEASDVDLSAMALQALAPYASEYSGYQKELADELTAANLENVQQSVTKALEFLSEKQQTDGGFLSWNEACSEPVSQALMALCALKVDGQTSNAFVKDSHTVLDALLGYQMPGGGFAHTKETGMSDTMACGQALCALTAYVRMQAGFSGLFDFSTEATAGAVEGDVYNIFTGELVTKGTEDFTGEDIMEYRSLPPKITTEYRDSVNRLLEKLKQASNRKEHTSVLVGLRQKKEEIAELQKEIDEINAEIPRLLAEDKTSRTEAVEVLNLLGRVERLSEYDRGQIVGLEELQQMNARLMSAKRSQVLRLYAGIAAAILVTLTGLNLWRRKQRAKKNK